MEQTGTEQLEYYLSSLDELGEILIDAEKAQSVGAGILRLTLGTVMASKGAIFLYNKKTEELSFLSSSPGESSSPIKSPKPLVKELIKHRHSHVLINNEKKVLRKYIGPLNEKDVYEIKKIINN